MISNQIFRNQNIVPFDSFQERTNKDKCQVDVAKQLPEILLISSYPARECGIATYSQDLIKALHVQFEKSFEISVCALETATEKHVYPSKVKYRLNTDLAAEYILLANRINQTDSIQMVLIQHEFGLFSKNEIAFQNLLEAIKKPIIIVYHTVLPKPGAALLAKVKKMIQASEGVIVMTKSSENILLNDYQINASKISVIPHGTHLVSQKDKELLKEKLNLVGKKVLSTFGLLSSGKDIETTLYALPSIVAKNPDVMFLIIGKTHPSVIKEEGERYREMLEETISTLKIEKNVRFVNEFLPLSELLDYLQLTDVYLFTSKDPNQAVSGTFSYALSSGCPIISTPIPHAMNIMKNKVGKLIDFGDSKQLSKMVLKLLKNENIRCDMSSNALHMMAPTAWENSAIAHARLLQKLNPHILLNFRLPEINLDHVKKLTTDVGMIQFSVINTPDLDSGYTLDDNARALVSICKNYELTGDPDNISAISKYLSFIKKCQQIDGRFLNYVDENGAFTNQNYETNLDDSNGRAIWALGYLVSLSDVLPGNLVLRATNIINKALLDVHNIHSTRAMAFIVKGLYYANLTHKSEYHMLTITYLTNRILQMYKHEASAEWNWYESYMTYANSILPEAMLCAYLATGNQEYKNVAISTFDFLLSKIFLDTRISVISNKGWLHKEHKLKEDEIGGEQAIDVAYTIFALDKFYEAFHDEKYKQKMVLAFSWFLGNNHLNQILYNPCTGGCYDGLEDTYVNLNQGAESTVSYLMARLTLEKYAHKNPTVLRDNIPIVSLSLAPDLLNLS